MCYRCGSSGQCESVVCATARMKESGFLCRRCGHKVEGNAKMDETAKHEVREKRGHVPCTATSCQQFVCYQGSEEGRKKGHPFPLPCWPSPVATDTLLIFAIIFLHVSAAARSLRPAVCTPSRRDSTSRVALRCLSYGHGIMATA